MAPSLDPIPDHVLARRRRIGQRIRDARIRADLSQERLGELTDLHRNTIGNVELGNYSPNLDSLLMIADAVRVPFVALCAAAWF